VAKLEADDGGLEELLARHLVGRSPSCDLVLKDPSVSGEHAVFAWDGEQWTVRDLSSRNGTRVLGRAVPAGESTPIALGDRFRFGRSEASWVLVDAEAPPRTGLPATVAEPRSLSGAELRFEVSSDEEHAGWSVVIGSTEHSLGARAHTYTILTLARARLEDANLPDDAQGWRVADDLARRLGITPEVLKVYVYRARKQLEAAGLPDGTQLVERRATANQIRLGTKHVVIHRI